MNIFRGFADAIHLFGIFILLFGMMKAKTGHSVSAISLVLYLLTYLLRYTDLFYHFVSVYNTIMKILFISLTGFSVLYIYLVKKDTINPENKKWWGVLPVAVLLGILVASEKTWAEILWASSIVLECFALLPQIFLVFQLGGCLRWVLFYLICIASYRLLYVVNWIYRYQVEGHSDPISWVFGTSQCVLTIGTVSWLLLAMGKRTYWTFHPETGDLEMQRYIALEDLNESNNVDPV